MAECTKCNLSFDYGKKFCKNCGGSLIESKDILNNAQELFDAKKQNDALNELNKIPSFSFFYDASQFLLAKIYYDQKSEDQFQETINKNQFEHLKVDEKQDLSDLIIHHVEGLIATENRMNAELLLKKLLQLNPKKQEQADLLLGRIYHLQGKKHYENNQLEEALNYLQQAKAYSSSDADKLMADIRFQKAKELVNEKKLTAALAEMKACLTIHPDNPEYIAIQSMIEQNLQKVKKAKIKKALPFVIGIIVICIAFLVYKKFLIGQVSIHVSPEEYVIKSNLPPLAEIKLIIDGKEQKNWGDPEPLTMSATNHIIEIEHDLYEKFIDTVKVKAGRLNEFDFTLKPKYANVLIKSNPDRAKIYLGNSYIGEAPKTFKVPLGNHQINLLKGDYFANRIITIKDFKAYDFNLEMKKFIEFIFVPGGTFEMGDLFGDGNPEEMPVHSVSVANFYMSKTEVTNTQYAAFLNAYGSDEDDQGNKLIKEDDWGVRKSEKVWEPQPGYENYPAFNVSWYGAAQFAKWAGYRLPTEAEWEYAAREGGKRIKWSGTSTKSLLADYAWYGENSDYKTHLVATKKPNVLGLYDMSGNTLEWCNDWYDKDYYQNSPVNNPKGPISGYDHVLRGGSWLYDEWWCRVSMRSDCEPDNRATCAGFRVVKESKR